MLRKFTFVVAIVTVFAAELLFPSVSYGNVIHPKPQRACGPVVVYTPNITWSPLWRIRQHNQKAWYHVQSCVSIDSQGNMWSELSVHHSSGPAYALGRCFVWTSLYAEYDYNIKSSNIKQFNCSTGTTVHYRYNNYALNIAYQAQGDIELDGGGTSGYFYSNPITVKSN